MPQAQGAGQLLCRNPACEKLWKTERLEMRSAFASIEDMLALECGVCKSTRADRCRVRQHDHDDTRHTESPFAEAPYIVPYNMPKYFAQQLRALQFAQTAAPAQQLVWIVARDMPYLGDIKKLKGAELTKREARWLQMHDQATVGIMGLFPATLGEPVRFTATQNKELRIFKNTRGILVNWELHPVDVALLQGQQAQELILKQTPRKLYVLIPGATWTYSQASLVPHGSLLCRSKVDNTYIQTQHKQKLFEVDFEADSIAKDFCFLSTLTHTYKVNLSRSCLRLTLRRIRVRLFFGVFVSQR